MLTDTHTHLYLEDFDADREDLITQAGEAGIKKFFLPNIDSSSVERLHTLAKNYPQSCFPMMGLHPCSVKENYLEELELVKRLLHENKYYAVGEIGIDLYWDKTFFEQQQEAFEKQILWALELCLPIVIHSRNSFDEVYAVLANQKQLPKGIFHCFSGNTEQAEKIIALGNFKLGIGGVVTFKNSGLDRVVKETDLKHLVLETDAPYLAPVPFRGKRNEPSYLKSVAEKIAEIKNISPEEVANVTSGNSFEVFGV